MKHGSYEVMLAKIRAHRYTREILAAALQPHELTLQQWLCLSYIFRHPNCSSRAIAGELDVTMPLITRVTAFLEVAGFITTQQSAHDARANMHATTSKGEKALLAAESDVKAALKHWLKGLTKAEIKTYMDVIMKVAAH